MTVDKAIEFLRVVQKQAPHGGNTLVVFGDGSPVALSFSDGKELSPDRFKQPVVQVRLAREEFVKA